MNTNICDPRYGDGPAVATPGAGGPFSAGKGALLTDGHSAYFEVGSCPYSAAPRNIADTLRPLMVVRVRQTQRVPLADLAAWLAQHFPGCPDCVEGFVDCDHARAKAEMVCGDCDGEGKMLHACTTRRGRIAGVPVYGWHVKRQLAAVLDGAEFRPAVVRLGSLRDDRGSAVLQVSSERWTYLRMGLVEPAGDDLPAFPVEMPW